jgi:hypothetical protein
VRACKDVDHRAPGKQRVVLNGGHRSLRRIPQCIGHGDGFFLLGLAAGDLKRSVCHEYLFAWASRDELLDNYCTESLTVP